MFALPFCHGFARPRIEPASLAAGAGILALAAVAVSLRAVVPNPQPLPSPVTVTLVASGASLPALRDAAEALRARLLAVPGIGAVRLHGLLTAGLEVDYAPARIAGLGLTEASLRAAVPATAAVAGRITVRPDAAEAGPQPIADTMLHAAGRTIRLGDVAMVARTPMDPVSVLSRDGHPAVELEVVPAPGIPPSSLDRPVAAALDTSALPGITLR